MKRVSTQSTLLTCLVLSASAAFVSSCQDYEPYNDQHLKDVAYTHEFERQFGKIDPNQNWDLYGQLYGNVYGQPKRNIGPLTRATTDEDEKPTFVDADFTYTISANRNQAYTYVLPEIGSPGMTYDGSNLRQVTITLRLRLAPLRLLQLIGTHQAMTKSESIGTWMSPMKKPLESWAGTEKSIM